MHSSYVHPKAIPGAGMAAETYQPRRDGLNAMKETKENSYLYVDSRRQETAVASIPAATRWPDNVVAQTSTARKKFHCPRCNSGYTRLSDMKTHCQFQCGKEPRYQCPYCTKTAKFSSNMYVHVRRMHKDKKLQIIDIYKLSRVRYWRCKWTIEEDRDLYRNFLCNRHYCCDLKQWSFVFCITNRCLILLREKVYVFRFPKYSFSMIRVVLIDLN